FLRGVERRIAAGLDPSVASVASVFVSRWDAAVIKTAPEALAGKLGVAIAARTYKAYRELLTSPRYLRVCNEGVRPQRLLWASTGVKDPRVSDLLYVKSLAAPFTVNTMPDKTLEALADHGALGDVPPSLLPFDGGDCEAVLKRFAEAGIDVAALAKRLQVEGGETFVKSWTDLMAVLDKKSAALEHAA
ncbi:MAG TPA: transaldolase family protein, partial [Polyangiaceae bacterium]|nr:transaldolase family protein [Polyangiaceae bacterium]